ncbi:MAG: 23S rRNA (uracil(1939)-C(5))-methyltransferase RlmD, partial [Acidobacteriota bacterium]
MGARARGRERRPVGLSPGERIELEITDLALGARGVGRREGLVMFVDGALEGERVQAEVRRVRSGYAEAVTRSVLRCSPDRVVPRCEHYGQCGGCDLQHLAAGAQGRAKAAQLRAILQRVARLPDPAVGEVARGSEPWEYRFRMDLDWGLDRAGRPILGLHRSGRSDAVFDLRTCHLMSRAANHIVRWTATRARELRLRPLDRRARRGFLRRLSVQEARGTREILLGIETARGDPPALRGLARELRRRFPRVVGVIRRETERGGRPLGESILDGRDHLFEVVDGDRFRVPASVFFQPSAAGAAALRREVMAALDPAPGGSVLELFCGVGLFTLAVARRASTVTAVEGSRDAIAAARENLKAADLHNVRLVGGDVKEALPGLLREGRWDALLVDPPRAGLSAASLGLIAGAGIRRMVYVSCDPGTLARDLRALGERGRFVPRSIVPVDLFPQTRHIECVVGLHRS